MDRLTRLSGRHFWLLLVFVAVFTRGTWAIALGSREPRFDEVNYIARAERLAQGQGYVDARGRPETYWPVGYPALLAAGYAVAGRSRLTGVLLQLGLGVATCALVFAVGKSAFGSRVGRAAAVLMAVYPTHVFYTTLHLTEPLFTVLLAAVVAFLLKSGDRAPGVEIVTGVVIGLAALVRPLIVMLPLALPIWYWSQGLRTRSILMRTALVGCCTLGVLSPWLVRNHGITGQWFLISTTGAHNFWMGNHPGAFGGYAYRREIDEQLRVGSERDFSRGYRLGLKAIADSPLRALLRSLQKVTYFLALETDGVLWNLKGFEAPPASAVTLVLLAAANGAYLFVIGFAVLGLMCTRLTHPASSLFLVISGYLVLIAAVFVGDPRYHYALVPIATIFTAKAAVDDWPALLRDLKLRKPVARKKLVGWASVVAVLAMFMMANFTIKEIEFRTLTGPNARTRIQVFGL